MLISSDDNHTSCLWSYPIYKIKEKQKKKEKSQLLEHRCTVMVRSGCWSACLNSEGSHHGRSRGLPRHRVHWFPSQGPMSAWLITRTTRRYQLPACCLYEQKHDMSDPPTCCFVWAYTLNVSWACPDFFTMFLCTSPFGPSCLSDVNIIRCRKTDTSEVCLMFVSCAKKQVSLNFVWC